jgi:hypothetical protein
MLHGTSDQPRTVLHIGPPKSGSTTLQEQVFPELGSICFMGKRWWNPDVPYDKCVALHQAIDSVTKADHASYDPHAAKLAVDEWLAHAPAAQPRADGRFLPRLLSEERLANTDVVDHSEIAARLADLFPGAEIVYVRRDPIKGLLSGHRWLYARAWIDNGFSDYIAQGMSEQGAQSWAAVALRSYDLDLVQRSFGAYFPTFRVIDFAQMLGDPAQFLASFIGHDDAEFEDFKWLTDKPLNVSRGRGASDLHRYTKKAIRLWNRLPFAKLDEKPEYLGDTPLWHRLEQIAALVPLSEARFRATAADIDKIHAYYEDKAASRRLTE